MRILEQYIAVETPPEGGGYGPTHCFIYIDHFELILKLNLDTELIVTLFLVTSPRYLQ